MKRGRKGAGRPDGARPSSERDGPPPPVPDFVPLKPRRGLLLALAIVFAAWLATLLILYITTVRPQRTDPSPAERHGVATRRS